MKGFSAEPGERGARDMSIAPSRDGVVIVGRADAGANFAARVVDDDDRRREFRPEPRDAVLRERLELGLQARVDRQAYALGAAVGGDGLLGGVRGQRRERAARLRNRLALGALRLRLR